MRGNEFFERVDEEWSILFLFLFIIWLAEKEIFLPGTVIFRTKWDDKFGPIWSLRPILIGPKWPYTSFESLWTYELTSYLRLILNSQPIIKSEIVTQSVEQVEHSEPDPDLLINIQDSECMVDIEIELYDYSSLWGRTDDIQLSMREKEEDFDQMNEEEELETAKVEKSS